MSTLISILSLRPRAWVPAAARQSVPIGSFLLVVAFASWLYFDRLGQRELWSSHEARAAQTAQRFLDEPGWGVLHLFDGTPEYQKPPLYYWLVALAAKCRGGTVDAWAVRLPAALAGLAAVFAVYGFLIARGRPLAALLAAFMLASTQHFVWITRTGRIDVPLTCAVTCSVLAWTLGNEPSRSRSWRLAWHGAAYGALALGVLLKGPLAVVLASAILASAAVINRATGHTDYWTAGSRSWVWGLPLTALIAVPWFVLAHYQTNGEFTRVFFWYHHIQRATGGAATLAIHPWWYYGPRLLIDFLPWSLLIPFALWYHRRAGADRDAAMGLTWLAAVTAVLSLSKFKRADYLLPAFPGAALWIGCVCERAYGRLRRPAKRMGLAVGVAIAAGGLSAGWAIVHRTIVPSWDAEAEKRSFATQIRAIAPRPTEILFFRVEDHALAFHLGRPLNTFMEWENLDVWAGRSGPHFIVMPMDCASNWQRHVTSGSLVEVLRRLDRSDRGRPRDLVLMRTNPRILKSSDERFPRTIEDRQGTNQRSAAGLQPGRGDRADR